MKNYKVSVIGAGNVGALTAMRLVEANLCDVALVDIVEGIAKGKAEDIMDAASVIGYDKEITGGTDFGLMKDSNVVVITAGLARKPGMIREDLLLKNALIVKEIAQHIAKYAPGAVIINVTNPLDAMTYVAYKYSNSIPKKVFGMAGLLDSSRMNLAISRAMKKPISKIDSVVLGTHGETMVPAISQSKAFNQLLPKALSQQQLKEVIDKTKNRGAEIVEYLKSGSAFFSPSACASKMVEIVLKDKRQAIQASCFLNGEYKIDGIFLGVPAVIGKNGVEKIIELELTQQELAELHTAAKSVRELINKCTNLQ